MPRRRAWTCSHADFAVSSPAPVLAAVAARTSRIRPTGGVTLLSVHDPVRVHQDFAIDHLRGPTRPDVGASVQRLGAENAPAVRAAIGPAAAAL